MNQTTKVALLGNLIGIGIGLILAIVITLYTSSVDKRISNLETKVKTSEERR